MWARSGFQIGDILDQCNLFKDISCVVAPVCRRSMTAKVRVASVLKEQHRGRIEDTVNGAGDMGEFRPGIGVTFELDSHENV